MNRPKPTPIQLEFLNYEMGMFFHFGIRTFNEENRDWDLLPMDPSTFDPKELDCDQWIAAAKRAGAKYAIMTTKHHDGFALWPSAYTDFSVKASPWKGGKGDVVREFTDACRRGGLKVGLYYSTSQFDAPARDDSYDDFLIGQITELLTNYGKIDLLWFDGCGSTNRTFDRERIAAALKDIYPAIVSGGFGRNDTRWIGNEWGHAPMSNVNLQNGVFSPGECDGCMTRINAENFWFYNDTYNDYRRTPDELVNMYYLSVGRGANLLLNVAPDRRGLIQDEDVRLLSLMKDEIDRRLHSCMIHTPAFEKLTDPKDGHLIFRVVLPVSHLVDHVVMEEDLTDGDHIYAFSIRSKPYENPSMDIEMYRGGTVGHKAICRFPTIRTRCIEVHVTEGDPEAVLKSLRLLYVGESSSLGNPQARL